MKIAPRRGIFTRWANKEYLAMGGFSCFIFFLCTHLWAGYCRVAGVVPKRPVRPVGTARTAVPGVPGLFLKLYGKSIRPLGKTSV